MTATTGNLNDKYLVFPIKLIENRSIGANQVVGLLKLIAFCQNPTLIEPRQEDLRVECLKYWRIPDVPKIPLPRFTTDDLLKLAVNDPSK